MNKIVLTSVAIFICTIALAQQMQVKQPNFATFEKQEKKIPPLLDKMSSPTAKQHPEYGILPFNSQCRECVELIDKRTGDSRFFVDPKNAGHTWSQQSYFPLHYKSDSNDVWHTIDQRLRPDANNPGVYVAKNQPVPTTLDLNKRNVSLDLGELQFSSDNDLTMYFFEPDKAYTQTEKGDYTHTTVGEEGLVVYNMWKGIDMRQMFMVGKIETNYVINSPLDIPVSDSGFMVIEDHFTIPDGYPFEEESPGLRSKEDYYRGDYLLKSAKGDALMTYEKPIYTDNNAFGMHGDYNLVKSGNNYTLQMMVPVSWMKNPNNAYPLIIDPIIEGSTKIGNYRSANLPSASMGFTTYTVPPGYCANHMKVNVPGQSQLTNAYVQIEWQLTYDNTCQISPPAPSPECSYTDVFQDLVCDTCNTVYRINCRRSANPNYVGTCTTDPNLVPGADSIPLVTNPPFLGCIPPQCDNYNIDFTLRNMDSVCEESCNYLCARGNIWEVTVECLQVTGNLTQDKSIVCPGQPIVNTAHPSGGVPPYHYIWTWGFPDTTFTIYGDSNFILYPSQNKLIWCIISDTCSVYGYGSVNLSDSVFAPSPYIRILGDTLVSSYTNGNQWYHNGSMLTGDTGQIIIDTLGGTYTVSVYDSTCGLISSLPTALTSIDNVSGVVSGLSISPNPSNGNFVLKFVSSQNYPAAGMSIYNNAGQLMDNRNVQIVAGANNYTFQTGERLAAGIYYLYINAGSKGFKQRFVVE